MSLAVPIRRCAPNPARANQQNRVGLGATAILCAGVGCGDRIEKRSGAEMHVKESKARLLSLLQERGIKVGRNAQRRPSPLRSAWSAFESFAGIPIARGDLTSDDLNDGLLYEAGVYDWGNVWSGASRLSSASSVSTRLRAAIFNRSILSLTFRFESAREVARHLCGRGTRVELAPMSRGRRGLSSSRNPLPFVAWSRKRPSAMRCGKTG